MIAWLTASLRRRKAVKTAAREARADLYLRAQAVIDGYDQPALAPAMERVAVTASPKRRRTRAARRLVPVLAGVLVAAVAGGSAVAYYTSSGHGSAPATAGTVSDITLSDGTPATALYPGRSADVAISVTNPNTIKVRIPSLELDSGGITVDGGHSGCDTSKLHYTTQDGGGSGYEVSPGTHPLDLSNAIAMDADAASACQGATFTVHLRVGT